MVWGHLVETAGGGNVTRRNQRCPEHSTFKDKLSCTTSCLKQASPLWAALSQRPSLVEQTPLKGCVVVRLARHAWARNLHNLAGCCCLACRICIVFCSSHAPLPLRRFVVGWVDCCTERDLLIWCSTDTCMNACVWCYTGLHTCRVHCVRRLTAACWMTGSLAAPTTSQPSHWPWCVFGFCV